MAQLDSIWETLDGKNNYPQIKEELLKRFGVRSLGDIGLKTICDTYSVEHQYARNVYRGVLKEGVEVSEIELAMICDGGYSFFGGHSTILKDRTFVVEIYID